MSDERLDDIETISQFDRDNFQEIENAKIEGHTEKALLINGHWLPKSRLRVDFDGAIYAENWLYGKHF